MRTDLLREIERIVFKQSKLFCCYFCRVVFTFRLIITTWTMKELKKRKIKKSNIQITFFIFCSILIGWCVIRRVKKRDCYNSIAFTKLNTPCEFWIDFNANTRNYHWPSSKIEKKVHFSWIDSMFLFVLWISHLLCFFFCEQVNLNVVCICC